MIYLDNNATTQPAPEVVDAMLPYLREQYGNPSSVYRFGSKLTNAVDAAREKIADLLGCDASEIVFTSGGTESNNAAISSALAADPDCQHVITSAVEHSAIHNPLEARSRRGLRVSKVGVDSDGALDIDQLQTAIDEDTCLISIMWANNETGVIFPLQKIAEISHSAGTIFHTDAVQAAGKIPVNLRETPVDLLSLSAHKIHGPRGIGALYINRRCRFRPLIIGGGQEDGRRGGTENVAAAVGMGVAAELAKARLDDEATRITRLRDAFEAGIKDAMPNVVINGARQPRLPNTSNLLFPGLEAEGLLMLLDQRGICASSGSACTTGSLDPSHVLTAMGASDEDARSSLRFSFSHFNSVEQIQPAVAAITASVKRLRSTLGGSVVKMN